jgi:hypothetical protein
MKLEIPQEMIDTYYVEFFNIGRDALEEIRDLISITIEIADDEPELLLYNEYKNDLIRAHAMKLALERRGILYDA